LKLKFDLNSNWFVIYKNSFEKEKCFLIRIQLLGPAGWCRGPAVCGRAPAEFIWGAEQQAAFEEIKEYLSTPPDLKAQQSGVPF
jgi:hypothetical protein